MACTEDRLATDHPCKSKYDLPAFPPLPWNIITVGLEAAYCRNKVHATRVSLHFSQNDGQTKTHLVVGHILLGRPRVYNSISYGEFLLLHEEVCSDLDMIRRVKDELFVW